MIASYESCYLPEAKRHLGKCTDYLVRDCRLAPETVSRAYATSEVMKLFGRGDPRTITGMSGIELGHAVYASIYGDVAAFPEATRNQSEVSVEYWGGWALAYFQWYWGKSFKWIFERTSLETVFSKYRVYHEMNIERFREDFMSELASVTTEPHLRKIRRAAGLSQSRLASLSGVNVRNIQLYEQRVQPIDRASASLLAALARPLGCSIEDLLEESELTI